MAEIHQQKLYREQLIKEASKIRFLAITTIALSTVSLASVVLAIPFLFLKVQSTQSEAKVVFYLKYNFRKENTTFRKL
ncbi:unnamed protein product [Meloidogyne enterolobii]|uniref:Uncharacterized protein n=1 Tax=Meloidogyne enterolobii TaxID=390850 RepID=A0ACB0Y6J5_MELEN